MYIALSIVVLLIGILIVLKPKIVYNLTQKWRSANNSEPSALYIFVIRFWGVLFVLLGIAALIILLFL